MFPNRLPLVVYPVGWGELRGVYVVAQFYLWFKFYFPLFQTNYHTLPYSKTKKNKILTKDKSEPQHVSQEDNTVTSISLFLFNWLHVWV